MELFSSFVGNTKSHDVDDVNKKSIAGKVFCIQFFFLLFLTEQGGTVFAPPPPSPECTFREEDVVVDPKLTFLQQELAQEVHKYEEFPKQKNVGSLATEMGLSIISYMKKSVKLWQ